MTSSEPTIESRRIYEGRILNLRVDTVRLPNGRTATREIVEHRDAVVIVALNERDEVLLVRQYRKAPEVMLLEAPAGVVDPGEEHAATALRELQEETGYTAARVEKLAEFYSSPGFCNELLHLYLATGLSHLPSQPDDDEIIELAPVPLRDVPALIARNEIRDAKSIAGLLAVLLLRRRDALG